MGPLSCENFLVKICSIYMNGNYTTMSVVRFIIKIKKRKKYAAKFLMTLNVRPGTIPYNPLLRER